MGGSTTTDGGMTPGARQHNTTGGGSTVPTSPPISFGAGRFIDASPMRDAQGLMPWDYQVPTPVYDFPFQPATLPNVTAPMPGPIPPAGEPGGDDGDNDGEDDWDFQTGGEAGGFLPGRLPLLSVAGAFVPALGALNAVSGGAAALQQLNAMGDFLGQPMSAVDSVQAALAGATGINAVSPYSEGLGGYGDIGSGGYTGMMDMMDPGVAGEPRAIANSYVANLAGITVDDDDNNDDDDDDAGSYAGSSSGTTGFEGSPEMGGRGYHRGGPVTDRNPTTYRENLPITAQEGEFVVARPAVAALGTDFLGQLNRLGSVPGK